MTREEIAAQAIEAWENRFSIHIESPDVIVIPADLDVESVGESLSSTYPLSYETPSAGSIWKLSGLNNREDYWEATLESISGPDYFRAQVFMTIDEEDIEIVEPEDLGVTATTVVS